MLKPEAATRKDLTMPAGRAVMQHRHFAVIAEILRDMSDDDFECGLSRGMHEELCRYFADKLRGTNPKFDRARFLRACGVED